MCVLRSSCWQSIRLGLIMLSDAIEIMVSTYLPLDMVARGLVVDPQDVADKLAITPPDTVEFTVLTVLAKFNPINKIADTEQ